jgi:transitional endoplasmic reticulum ATPase
MDDEMISGLLEALAFSPDNVPLRLHLAETLYNHGKYADAKEHCYIALRHQPNNTKAKEALAKASFRLNAFSECIIVLEELERIESLSFSAQLLLTQAYVKEKSISKAIESYQAVLKIDPRYRDKELDAMLRTPSNNARDPFNQNDGEDFYEDEDDEDNLIDFMEKPDVNFSDVGGMDEIKKQIDLKIIKPLQHQELYSAYGKKIGGGILLYGPPGCGKTFIAKATAGEIDSNFLSIGLNDILDMWIGNSERALHEVFEFARSNTPCVIFIDEIDALGANRGDLKASAGRNIINQFLAELDGATSNNEGILVVGATNAPWHLDPAFRRPGRFDRIIFVPPPDDAARESIFELKLKGKPTQDIDMKALGKKTAEYSGADIEAIIDIAIEEKLEAAFIDGVPKPLTTKDLLNALKKHSATTKEWFKSAKNFALFANESGLYDDILDYLKIKK